MIILNKEPVVVKRGNCKLSEIIFRHQSPHELDIISPQTYSQIKEYRSENMSVDDLETYMKDRIEVENKYYDLINQSQEVSFIYATIVGFNNMEDPTEYPGFTYYFKITPEKLKKTIFELVAGKDIKMNLEPDVGIHALENCLKAWNANKQNFTPATDSILGTIEPRIEVVLSYDITPYAMIPEVEQR